MRVAILNDCSHLPHFGCKLVMEAFRSELERVGIELLYTHKSGVTQVPWNKFLGSEVFRQLARADLVIINGEGSIHDDAHPGLIRIARELPCVLMNGVYQNNTPMPEMGDFLFRSMRESLSAAEVAEEGHTCSVIPDVVLVAPTLLGIGHHPAETDICHMTDSSDPDLEGIGLTPLRSPGEFIFELSWFRGWACGRFHAAIICAALGIPFSGYPANTHKIKGLMIDMGAEDFYFDTMGAALSGVPYDVPNSVRRWVVEGRLKIHRFFNTLEDKFGG